MRPSWFNFETCFVNFIKSIEKVPANMKVTLTIVFDGSEEVFSKDFSSKYVKILKTLSLNYKLLLIFVNGGSNVKSWLQLLEIIRSKYEFDKDDLIYFLENDYLHTEDWLHKIQELVASQVPWDYVSLYDHKDKYEFKQNHPLFIKNYSNLKSKIFVTKSSHWRSVPSTCGSFIVRPQTLYSDVRLLSFLPDRYLFPILKLLKRRRLITPMPGLSTHCMESLLSPCIDWHEISQIEGIHSKID